MKMKTFCPECGFGVKVDVDGCCLYCGSVATGSAVDELSIPCSCKTVIYHKGYICKDCSKAVVEVAKPCIECGETGKHLRGCKIGSMFNVTTETSDICPNCEQPLMCGQDGLPFCFGCGYAGEEGMDVHSG